MAALAYSESIDQDTSVMVNDSEVPLRPKSRHVLQVDKLPVQHVTVYQDKAEVSRKITSLMMTAGINEVRCTRLAAAIDKDTLRVDVKSVENLQVVTSINDVNYVSRYLPDEESDFHRSVKELQDSLDGLTQQRETLATKLFRLEKQRAVLDTFADCFVQKGRQGDAEKGNDTAEKTAEKSSEKADKRSEKEKEKEKEAKLASERASAAQNNQNAFELLCNQSLNGNVPLGISAGAFGAAKVVECMSAFFDLFDKQATQLDIGLQQTRRQLDKIDADIRTHQTKLKELTFFRDEHQERELIVVVEVSEATAVELSIAYVVSRAKWTPRYDVRVYAADSMMKVFYYGVVQQSTGEDWLDAQLTLSTAQPAIGGAVPELVVHKIGFKSKLGMPETPFRASRARKSNRKLTRANTTVSQSPGPHTNGPVAASKTAEDLERSRTSNLPSGSGRYSTALEDFNLNAYRDVLSDVETDPSAPPLTPARNGQFDSLLDDDNESTGRELNRDQTASVPVSSTFEVARTYSVPCNASTIKVMIALIDLPATLEYEANPRRSPFAFVRASAKNLSPYALIAGTTNVYLNNQFVARSDLRTVLPQESFVAHLGADPGVRIVYRPLFKTRESGMVLKTTVVTHKQMIEVRNSYDKPIRILVADQVPLSNEEKIKVNILEPTIKHPEKYDRSKPIRLHPRTNIVEWDLEVAARESKEVVLKYAVEYPTSEGVDYTTEA